MSSSSGPLQSRIRIPISHHSPGSHYLWLKVVVTALRIVTLPLRGLTSATYLSRSSLRGKIQTQTLRVPSRDPGRTIKVISFSRKASTSTTITTSSSSPGPKPVLLNFHGSGFVIPDLGGDSEWCATVAERLDCVVLNCDYRKAPEWPFPAALMDVEDCLFHVLSSPQKYDPTRISISGFSAGGNLSLSISTLWSSHLRSTLTFYPPVNFHGTARLDRTAPEKSMAQLSPTISSWFDQSYLLPGKGYQDHPLVSVIDAPVQSFPEHVWICCGRGDTLYNESRGLYERMVEGRHPHAEFHAVPAEGHAFDKITVLSKTKTARKDEAYARAVSFLEKTWDA